MKEAAFLIICACSLIGCAPGTQLMASEYAPVKPIRIATPATAAYIPKSIDVKLHPTDPARAMVQAAPGEYWSRLMTSGEQWRVTINEQRVAYQAALIQHLAAQGKTCEVLTSTPYPDYFMFEFTYRCY